MSANADAISDADIAAMISDANAELKQTLILNFKATKIPNLDKDSKSDPFIVLYALKPNA